MYRNINKILLTAIVLFLPAIASAQGIGNVVSFVGQVRINRGHAVLPVSVGMALMKDDTVTTGHDGRVRILFVDDSVVNIGSDSSIDMARYTATPSKRDVLLSAVKGKIRFYISRVTNAFNTYDVHTVTAVIGIRGTDFIVDASGDTTGLYVIGGIVGYGNVNQPPSAAIEVTQGTVSFVRGDKPPTMPTAYSGKRIQELIEDTTVPFNDDYTTGFNAVMPQQYGGQPPRTASGVPNAYQQPVASGQGPASTPVPVNVGANYGNVAR